ncbi:MAG: hypothetical protein ACE5LV_05685 [Candidatus Aminicenantales bacterium]
MKKQIALFLVIGLVGTGLFVSSSGTSGIAVQQEELPVKPKQAKYNPAGRRDPFRNLLAGQEAREKGLVRGIRQISVDDAILIGIAKSRGKLTAIINGPQGFAYTIRKGDQFLDGFVLTIDETRVVFRKTQERGIPLFKPRDIVKEIKLEER